MVTIDPDPPTRLRSLEAVIGGSVLLTAGTASLLAGGVMAFLYGGRSCEPAGVCHDSNAPYKELLVAGGIGLAAGIPLIVVGAWRVPANAASRDLPAWAGAPVAKGWQWRF